ncbi:Fc.00g023450.m01.CDS01 [Cosmosporella sp. VM-42]
MTGNLPNVFSRFTRLFSQSSHLSIAPDSSAATSIPTNVERCTIAAGCFWGVEHRYRQYFEHKGLIDAKVGYIGGHVENPSYEAVCSKRSGHAEALDVLFDPTQVTYRQLIEFFYRMHDPTTLNQQGADSGPQYRSGIYFHNAEQEKIAREVTALANAQWWHGEISTEIVPAGKWWTAEEYHQLYLDNNPAGYQCPTHYLRTKLAPLKA